MQICLRKLRLLSRAVRLLAVVLLVALAGAMPANIAATYAELCCEGCEGEDESDCSDDHEKDCDCPLGCNACCRGPAAPAIAPHAPGSVAAPVLGLIGQSRVALESPPEGVARDILHVPKLVA